MNITFVLGVYNQLHLTKECYQNIRELYPDTPIVISSGGSTDGTKLWLTSLNDENLSFFHDDERITLSDTYNYGIRTADTEKVVLIHNDMVIGKGFLENLEELLDENTILSYTTIEPPIFKDHTRPGKLIMDFGSSFDDFKKAEFNEYLATRENIATLENGATFFMSGFKSAFEKIGYFDGFTFSPFFCEDDDFLIRAKIKGFELKTTQNAIVYHFVSKTSRFSEENKLFSKQYEIMSNRNFIRKWGMPVDTFKTIQYWNLKGFSYKPFSLGLTTLYEEPLHILEPFFNKINCSKIPYEYIKFEHPYTNLDIESKFTSTDDVDVMIYADKPFSDEDIIILYNLRIILSSYSPGEYVMGNLKVHIKTDVIGTISFLKE